jgi:hypothetical protein
MPEEITYLRDEALKKPRKSEIWLPSVEKPEFVSMFSYYQDLGRERSYVRVAKHFGRSTHYIYVIAKAFHWQDRLQAIGKESVDAVVVGTQKQVDDSRTKLADIAHDIVSILYEMSLINARLIQNGESSDNDKKKVKSLKKALNNYGIGLMGPRGMKDLIGVLRDIVTFKDTTQSKPGPDQGKINIDKAVLIVKDD